MRREWLTNLIREVHLQSRGTYSSRRVHAELTKGLGVYVSERLVAVLMHHACIYGLPGCARSGSVALVSAIKILRVNRSSDC